jgi:hypothetical protein
MTMTKESIPGGIYENQINTILNKILIRLDGGPADIKQQLISGISMLMGQNVGPSLSEYALGSISEYRANIDPDAKINIFNALEELFVTAKTNFHKMFVGSKPIDETFAFKEHVFNSDYRSTFIRFLMDLQIKEDPNTSEILDILLKATNSDKDYFLKNLLSIDLSFANLDSAAIASALSTTSLSTVNQNTITNAFYNAAIKDDYLSDLAAIKYVAQLFNFNFTKVFGDVNFKDAVQEFLVYYLENNYRDVPHTIMNICILVFLILFFSVLSYHHFDIWLLLSVFYFGDDIASDMYASNLPAEEIFDRVINALKNGDYNDPVGMMVEVYKSFYKGIGMVTGGQRDFVNNLNQYFFNFTALPQSTINNYISFINNKEYIDYHDLASSVGTLSSNVDYIHDIPYLLNYGYVPQEFVNLELEMDMIGSGFPVSLIANNFKFLSSNIDRIMDYDLQTYNQTMSFDLYSMLGNDIYTAFNLGPHYQELTSSIATATSLDSFVSNVRTLSSREDINDNHALATSIASFLPPYSSVLANQLASDITMPGLKIEDIKYYLNNVDGISASQVAASLYVAWGGAFISAMEGARLLASSIYTNNISAAQISEYFSANSLIEPKYDEAENFVLAKAIDQITNPGNVNKDLINSLYLDFDASGMSTSQIVNIFANIEGADAAEIVASLYRQMKFPYDSAVKGKLALANALNEHFNSDYYVTLTSLEGNTDISPVVPYLNFCSKLGDGVYKVEGSVFVLFDPNSNGRSLYQMEELYSESGRLNARAQCGRQIIENFSNDLYVTTTNPAGVTGSLEETGCSPALDSATFMAFCDSAFAEIIPG